MQGFASWGPAEGLALRTSQGRPKRVMRKACALSTAQPLASLPGYFYFFSPAELRPRGAGSPPQPVKPAADPGHSLGSRLPEASGCGHVVPPHKPGSSRCVITRKSGFGTPALSPPNKSCHLSLSNAWRSSSLAGHVKGQMIYL